MSASLWTTYYTKRFRTPFLELKKTSSYPEFLHTKHIKNRRSQSLIYLSMKRTTEVLEEDKVVYLLASLPDSFASFLKYLTKMDMVSERLLHEERKMKFNRRTNYIHLIFDQH